DVGKQKGDGSARQGECGSISLGWGSRSNDAMLHVQGWRGQPISRSLAARSLQKGRALLSGGLQAVGQARGQLFGGPALVGLNVTEGHCRAAYLRGQLFECQVERSAALPHPGAEREQLAHGPLQAGVRHSEQPASTPRPRSTTPRAASATQSIL